MFSALAWGSILDRIGVRLGTAISLFIWMVSSASHAVARSFLTFAVARAALGVGEGSVFPGGFRTAVDSLPIDTQARGMALAYSGSSLGSIIAPILLTPIAIVRSLAFDAYRLEGASAAKPRRNRKGRRSIALGRPHEFRIPNS